MMMFLLQRHFMFIGLAVLVLLYVFLAYKVYYVAKLFGLFSASSSLAGVPWG